MTAGKVPSRREVQIAIGLGAALLLSLVLFSAEVVDPRGYDFAELYTGGLIIRLGEASRFYDLGEQARIERQVLNLRKFLINIHPPFEALLFAVLTRLPYGEAYVVWGALNVLLWAFSLYLVWCHSPIPPNPSRYCLLGVLYFPLWLVLVLGQTTLLLLFLLSLTFVCLKRGQDFRAGIFLGLGLFKFPVVIPFALICFLRSKWRLMAGLAAAASLLGILSVIAVGPAGVRAYANLLVDILRYPNNPTYVSFRAWRQMPIFKGFFSVLLADRLAAITLLAAVGSALLILFAAWRWRQAERGGSSKSLEPMFAAALAVSQVTAPYSYGYDLTLMLLPVALVLGSSQWAEKSGPRAVLSTIIVILYTPPVYVLLLWRHIMSILAPVLVLFALAAIRLARRAPHEMWTGEPARIAADRT